MKKRLQSLKERFKKEQPALALKQFTLFSTLKDPELKIVYELTHSREYEAGEKIYETGFPIELLFFIQSGEIGLSKSDTEPAFQVIKAGELLGLKDLEGGARRSHYAIAHSPVKLLALSQTELKALCKNLGGLAKRLNAAIEQELNKGTAQEAEA